ncbi:MAG: UDP-2,3-diacylglucosamine diphosphatase LpxI, partial [Proteobacteria bacterium]|nr:UDP-2,3-diacylglucosamine diphosphatase LpxI [Pseudomonadota bacterium]
PIEIAEAGARQGRSIHIVAIEGFAAADVARYSHERVSLGQVGRILASFRKAGVDEIVIAGAMQRPDLLKLRVDWGFFVNLPTVLKLTKGGDDSVLRRIVRFFEGHGLTVVGVQDVAPALLAPSGPLTSRSADPSMAAAISRAAALIRDLGPFDVGQAVVASSERIVAVEGVRGTDALLSDLGPDGPGKGLGQGGVLVKLPKPGQEMRIDLPTIGPRTIERARAAQLSGVAVGAGQSIVLERARVAADADAAGIVVIGLDLPSLPLPPPVTDAEPPSALAVVSRRAPTPGDRIDIAIGRRVIGVLQRHGAGHACVVAREHVLAISGRLDVPAVVRAQGRIASWGRRSLGSRLGTLVIDGAATPAILDADLFRAALETRLAGIVFLGGLPTGETLDQLKEWAREAKVFLMSETAPQ